MQIYLVKGYLDVAATSLADAMALASALANPSTSVNAAAIARITGKIETLVQSDSGEPLVISCVDDAAGTISAWVTNTQTTVAIGLGAADPTATSAYASTTNVSISGSTRTATLALNTAALANALRLGCADGRGAIGLVLQIRITNAAGARETVGLIPVTVCPGVLEFPVEDRDAEYVTYAEVAAAAAAAAASQQSSASSSASASSSSAAAASSANSAANSASQAASSAASAGAQAAIAVAAGSGASASATAAANSATAAFASETNASSAAAQAAADAALILATVETNFTVLSETSTGLSVTIGAAYSPTETSSPYPSVSFILP